MKTCSLCNGIKKYGNYCYKHRSNYLLIDNVININKFTWNMKDYTISDIKKSLYIKKFKNLGKYKKKELYEIYLNSIKHELYILNIIKIQKNIRRYLKYNNYLRGPGYFDIEKCKNKEDLLFMEPIKKSKFFFSYEDNLNNIWFFDIRTFKKIIDSNKLLNPWTRDTIPINIINKFYKLLKFCNINVNMF